MPVHHVIPTTTMPHRTPAKGHTVTQSNRSSSEIRSILAADTVPAAISRNNTITTTTTTAPPPPTIHFRSGKHQYLRTHPVNASHFKHGLLEASNTITSGGEGSRIREPSSGLMMEDHPITTVSRRRNHFQNSETKETPSSLKGGVPRGHFSPNNARVRYQGTPDLLVPDAAPLKGIRNTCAFERSLSCAAVDAPQYRSEVLSKNLRFQCRPQVRSWQEPKPSGPVKSVGLGYTDRYM